jgi:hypothetical protein
MIIDKYTKIVLTVIAVSLVTIAFSNINETMIEPAMAGSDCGDRSWNPCYVEVTNTVRVRK